jgi:hypothetical protein
LILDIEPYLPIVGLGYLGEVLRIHRVDKGRHGKLTGKGYRNTTSLAGICPKPENKLDRKNKGETQGAEAAFPACRTNRYIPATYAEPDYILGISSPAHHSSQTFRVKARVPQLD